MSSRSKKSLIVFVLAIAFLVGQAVYAATWFSPTRLAVWVFDVGQGDAIFIDAPDMQILIDGGPNADVLERLSDVLPIWDRSLDLMIATHPHADHVLGLDAVLERYSIEEIVDDGLIYNSASAIAFEQLGGDTATVATKGTEWDLGNGATLRIVWPSVSLAGTTMDDVNDGSVVALLTYGDTTMLLTGDAGVAEEEIFALGLPHIDVLKVGHHGSDTSTGPSLVNLITPDYAVISVGEGNSYKHPSVMVVDRLRQAGAEVFRTDFDGDLRILTDGGEPEITAFPR